MMVGVTRQQKAYEGERGWFIGRLFLTLTHKHVRDQIQGHSAAVKMSNLYELH